MSQDKDLTVTLNVKITLTHEAIDDWNRDYGVSEHPTRTEVKEDVKRYVGNLIANWERLYNSPGITVDWK